MGLLLVGKSWVAILTLWPWNPFIQALSRSSVWVVSVACRHLSQLGTWLVSLFSWPFRLLSRSQVILFSHSLYFTLLDHLFVITDILIVPSKFSLARVATKVTLGSSSKKPKFSHNRSVEKGTPSSTPQVIVSLVGMLAPSILDLEAALESAPIFDECIEDLPQFILEGSDRGKEKLPPSMLTDEEELVSHLRSVISDQDI